MQYNYPVKKTREERLHLAQEILTKLKEQLNFEIILGG